MITTSKAQNELNTIKEYVIGLFKVRGRYHLVMNHQPANNTIDCIFITEFGAIQHDYNISCNYGRLKLFPDNQTMSQLLNKPFEWQAFIETFDFVDSQ